MLIQFYVVFCSLVFAAALEFSVFREALFFKVLAFLVIFSLLVLWPLTRKLRFVAIPFFLSIGSLSLLYLIDAFMEKQAFVLLSTSVYYLGLLGAYRLGKYDCDQTAQGMINVATIATAFFWYTSSYGWYLNFQIEVWMLMIVFIFSTFLISLPSLRICAALPMKIATKKENGENVEAKFDQNSSFCGCKKVDSFMIFFLNIMLSLVMAQVIWALSLWPLRYLTTGVVALIIYFMFWDVLRNFIQGTLAKSWFLFNLILAAIAVVSLLATARWMLVV